MRSPGVNVPIGRLSSSLYQAFYVATTGGEYYAGTAAHNLLNISGNSGASGILKPEEAWNMDTKLDDGKPGLGKITTFLDSGTLGPNCSNGDTTAAEYDFTITALNCRLLYQLD